MHAHRRTVWGKEQLLPVVCRDRREIFVGVGDSHGRKMRAKSRISGL